MTNEKPWWLGPLAVFLPTVIAPRFLAAAGMIDGDLPMVDGLGNLLFGVAIVVGCLAMEWHSKNRRKG